QVRQGPLIRSMIESITLDVQFSRNKFFASLTRRCRNSDLYNVSQSASSLQQVIYSNSSAIRLRFISAVLARELMYHIRKASVNRFPHKIGFEI
ncbi:hypothetical protein, partial [Cohnella lubricantis]